MKNKRIMVVALGLCLVLCITLIAGFQYKKNQARKIEERRVATAITKRIAPSLFAEMYKMPQKDYDKLMRTMDQIHKERKVSDDDLDWLLAYLKPSSTYFVQIRIIGILQLLGNAPAQQKEKIRVAILPYIKENSPRYRNSMRRLQKFVFGNPNWKPGQMPH